MAGIPRKRPSGLGYMVLEDSSTGAGAGADEVSGDMRGLNELPTRGVVGLGVENSHYSADDNDQGTEPDRRDSQFQQTSSWKSILPRNVPSPPSCLGHFDRLGSGYASKPDQRTVVVYWDEDAASSASSVRRAESSEETRVVRFEKLGGNREIVFLCGEDSDLENAEGQEERGSEDGWDVGMGGVDGKGFGDGGAQGGGSSRGIGDGGLYRDKGKERAIDLPGFWVADGGLSSMTYVDDNTSTPPSPGSLLTSLRITDNAVDLPAGRDGYFAARLASASVSFIRDGRISQAARLSQWSVDLVGKELWDRMVVQHASSPRLDNDDGRWVRYLLGEVVIVLGKIDAARSAELQHMVLGWEAMGVFPSA